MCSNLFQWIYHTVTLWGNNNFLVITESKHTWGNNKRVCAWKLHQNFADEQKRLLHLWQFRPIQALIIQLSVLVITTLTERVNYTRFALLSSIIFEATGLRISDNSTYAVTSLQLSLLDCWMAVLTMALTYWKWFQRNNGMLWRWLQWAYGVYHILFRWFACLYNVVKQVGD